MIRQFAGVLDQPWASPAIQLHRYCCWCHQEIRHGDEARHVRTAGQLAPCQLERIIARNEGQQDGPPQE